MAVFGYRITREPSSETVESVVKNTIERTVAKDMKIEFKPAHFKSSLVELEKNLKVRPLQLSRQILTDLRAHPQLGTLFLVIPNDNATIQAFAENRLIDVANTIIVAALTGTPPDTAVV
ncbi:MAG: hypothetical protein WAN86_18780 [Hyphomicrobiaceae bacterium]